MSKTIEVVYPAVPKPKPRTVRIAIIDPTLEEDAEKYRLLQAQRLIDQFKANRVKT